MYCIIIIGAHRALPDVLAMERVLLHPSLVRCLSSLTIRCPQQQVKLWMDQKESFLKAAVIIKAFGNPCLTTLQAKKLDSLGLTYEDLAKLLQETGGGETFHKALKDKGINSKLLREKLASSLSHSR